MIKWPPNKAWTCTSKRNGFRHFVAINYGGEGIKRWVLMVSVLDGKVRFIVDWIELIDVSKWQSGWMQLSREEANSPMNAVSSEEIHKNQTCLHPSIDSGLLAPLRESFVRPWLYD